MPGSSTAGSSLDMLLRRARELTRAQRYTDALRLMETVVGVSAAPAASTLLAPSASPGPEDAADPRLLALRLNTACVLFELGRYEAALATATALQHADLDAGEAAQRDAIQMRCALRLRMWRRCVDHAHELMTHDDDDLAVEALCTIGRVHVAAWSRPDAAGEFFKQALQRDPTCASAWDAIVDQWLLPPAKQRELLHSLDLPEWAGALKYTYASRLQPVPELDTSLPHASAVNDSLLPQSPEEARELGLPLHVAAYVRARQHYQRNALREALADVSVALAQAPEYADAIVLKLAVLVDLRATNELFEYAHRVADELKPSPALMAYAVGCYYLSIASFDEAGRYFCRATEADPQFAPAWIAYGNNYARLEEGEQALSAYRKAQSLFPALTAIRTYIGTQHLRSGHPQLALCFLEESDAMASGDPLTLNELGVHALKHEHNPDQALHYFTLARDALPNRDQPSEYHDCILFNLATTLRRLGHFDQALIHFQHYARVRPYAAAAHSGLALTHHIMGDLRQAIDCYHRALAIKGDTATRDLLERALQEEMQHGADAGPSSGPHVHFSPAFGGGPGQGSVGGPSHGTGSHEDWGDSDHRTAQRTRPYARPSDGGSPAAATPGAFSLSAISRIARSESQQAPPIVGAEGASPSMHRNPTAAVPGAGINRALTF